jgi:hypothetical protein
MCIDRVWATGARGLVYVSLCRYASVQNRRLGADSLGCHYTPGDNLVPCSEEGPPARLAHHLRIVTTTSMTLPKIKTMAMICPKPHASSPG